MRIHLRNEFYAAGFRDVLPDLRNTQFEVRVLCFFMPLRRCLCSPHLQHMYHHVPAYAKPSSTCLLAGTCAMRVSRTRCLCKFDCALRLGRVCVHGSFFSVSLSLSLSLTHTHTHTQELKDQIEVFEDDAAQDWQEMLSHFGEARLQVTDEVECCMFLRGLVYGTPSEPYFLSILQHLLFIRDDHVTRFVCNLT